MRQVSNVDNGKVLSEFQRQIILPLFQICLEKQQMQASTVAATAAFRRFARPKSALRRVLRKTVHRKTVESRLESLAGDRSSLRLSCEVAVFFHQNRMVAQGKYSLSPVVVREEWKDIFVDCFYDRLFSDDRLWELLGFPGYSKTEFHTRFEKENALPGGVSLPVCPACDLETLHGGGSPTIDHLLPKSEFPFLAMASANLLSTCWACNTPGSGKGTQLEPDAVMPYNETIGASVDFIDEGQDRFLARSDSRPEVASFLRLYGLQKRYGSDKVFQLAECYANEVQESVGGNEGSREEISEYFNTFRVIYPLFFASREVLFRRLG